MCSRGSLICGVHARGDKQVFFRRSPGRCVYTCWGRWGREKARIKPQSGFGEEVLEMRCCDSAVLGLSTQLVLPECWCYSWCTGHHSASKPWLQSRGEANVTGEDSGLVSSQRPGKGDLHSETSLLVRLSKASEQSPSRSSLGKKSNPNICKTT